MTEEQRKQEEERRGLYDKYRRLMLEKEVWWDRFTRRSTEIIMVLLAIAGAYYLLTIGDPRNCRDEESLRTIHRIAH